MLSVLRTFAAGTVVLLFAATNCPATTLLVDGYSMRVWQTDDGLPKNMVTSAVQTKDGYVWLGTYNGLARFDGERFHVFNSANTPGLQDRFISCLFEDSQGYLWIGHESGGISRYRDGRFESFAAPAATLGEKVIGLGSDERGQLWAMRENGAIDSLDNKGFRLPSLIAPALPGIMSWSHHSRGHIWVAENSQVARLQDNQLTSIPVNASPIDNNVFCVASAADGGVWILFEGRIRKWANGRWSEDRGRFPWPEGSVACFTELRDGTLAVGTIFSGLYLIYKDSRQPVHIDRTNGLPQNWVRFLYEDREGTLWAGAGSAGLVSIHATAFSVLNSPDQWQGCAVLSVAPGRDGSLWIGTDGAALYRYSGGNWQHYGDPEGLTNWYISAVAESANGELWAGYLWWGSPYRFVNGRFVRPEPVAETSSPVSALLVWPGTDDVLAGSRDGLVRLNKKHATWLMKPPDSSAGAVCAIAFDRRGGIWCGLEKGGLAHLAEGKLSTFRRSDGLASDAVQCLLVDNDDSIWIGTADAGLSRYKNGRFSNVSMANGLVDDAVCSILDDGLGYFWLSSHHGLQRVAKAELSRCANGEIPVLASRVYNRDDGLPVSEFTERLQAAACKTKDGRLWFASSRGVVTVDPSRIESNSIAPPVVLESFLVDGKPLQPLADSSPMRLSPNHQRLEFLFAGLSFVAPSKVLFKYRLEGLDHDWIEAGARRTAFYSHLPAGDYRFRVIACNSDGVWNTTGASLAFTVAPFLWQTWWFIGCGIVIVLAVVTAIVRHLTQRRMQRRMEQLERQQAIERERARIAQDIHDDIGTSLTRITMLSHPARLKPDQPQQTTAVLTNICSTASEATRSLDEIVWAVDPRHDTLDSAIRYMGKFAQDLLGPADIRCRLDIPFDPPAWPLTADLRHNLFLAFKEALHNAVKHSAATEVHIALEFHSDEFVLTVKDNGHGFDHVRRDPGNSGRIASGNGLVNMERRLSRIGGRCEIVSSAAQGTSVAFIVAVPPASHSPEPSRSAAR